MRKPIFTILVALFLVTFACFQIPAQSNESTPLNRTDLSAGYQFSVMIDGDGLVYSWGSNHPGKLGINSFLSRDDSSEPVKVSSITNVAGIFTGYDHAIAVTKKGTVYTWGANVEGQLGDGMALSRSFPEMLTEPSGVIDIAAGYGFTIALDSDGSVWIWGTGLEKYSSENPPPSIRVEMPRQFSTLKNILDVGAGLAHALVITEEKSVRAWGLNWDGQLGDGTEKNRNHPVLVHGLNDVVTISGGAYHSVALRSDGTVWSWGRNFHGQLGDGTREGRSTPVMVPSLDDIVAISAGAHHTIALRSDGTVWAWGDNVDGQLGDGTYENRMIPVQVTGLEGVISIAAGWDHSLARKSDGSIWAWGGNSDGQLGNGTEDCSPVPVSVQK